MIKSLHNSHTPQFPGATPTSPVVWPAQRQTVNKIQQTRASAKPSVANVLPTTQPNVSATAPRTTPQHVSGVRVTTRATAGAKQVTVQFRHPAGDPYFAGASVYLKRGSQPPTLVSSGAASPLTFSTPTSTLPHSLFVVSNGNWGSTDILKSPSARVRLNG